MWWAYIGGGGLTVYSGAGLYIGGGGGLIVGGLRYYLDIDGSIAKLDIDSWKEHHKISITANFVYLLRGENRYPVLKTVSIWPCINTKLDTNFSNSRAFIFDILQHFATKLCNYTNFIMLFQF